MKSHSPQPLLHLYSRCFVATSKPVPTTANRLNILKTRDLFLKFILSIKKEMITNRESHIETGKKQGKACLISL